MMGFGPGGMDCDEVLADVYLYLDDESDPAVKERIRAHIDDCAPCLRQFGLVDCAHFPWLIFIIHHRAALAFRHGG